MKRKHSPNLGDEIQSSYKRICDIKREQISYDQRLAQIEIEIDKLTKERRECSNKRAKLLSKELPQAIVPYSQSSTLQIVTKMRSYLPRELRDMVYEYLIQQTESIMPTWKIVTLASRPECPGRHCRCLNSLNVPFTMDPAYIGHEMAREVVEVFYKTWSHLLFEADRVEQIKNALMQDHFHVGFKPADHAREMLINWKLSRSVREYTTGEERSRRPTKKDFSPLLKIRNKSGFKLRITLSQRHIRFLPLERAITIIKPICQQLVKEGVKVELEFYYDINDGPKFSLTDALTKPVAAWKKNLAEQLDEDEDVLDHHREYKHENVRKFQSETTSSEDSEMDEDSEDMDDMYDDTQYGYGAFDDELYAYGEDLYDMGIY